MVKITYFSIIGYDEDLTEQYQVETIECENGEQLEYYLNCIDENLIIGIEY